MKHESEADLEVRAPNEVSIVRDLLFFAPAIHMQRPWASAAA